MKLYTNGRFNSEEVAEAIEKHRREHGDCYFENEQITNPSDLSSRARSFREKVAGWPRSPNSYRRSTAVKLEK